MLKLTIPANELWDDNKECFIVIKETRLLLEHSLISISKWEAKWKKPFLNTDKTSEELIDYIRCMTITPNVDPTTYFGITSKEQRIILEYIKDPYTATTFREDKNNPNAVRKSESLQKRITSEEIYYWMIANGIPFECEKWNLNRLLTLIRICNIKNQPEKKMSKKDAAAYRNSLNASRRAKMHTKG